MAPVTSKGLIEMNSSFIISALSIAFNPTFWNIVARQGELMYPRRWTI